MRQGTSTRRIGAMASSAEGMINATAHTASLMHPIGNYLLLSLALRINSAPYVTTLRGTRTSMTKTITSMSVVQTYAGILNATGIQIARKDYSALSCPTDILQFALITQPLVMPQPRLSWERIIQTKL